MVTGLLLVTNHIKSRLLVTNPSSWFRPEAQPFPYRHWRFHAQCLIMFDCVAVVPC